MSELLQANENETFLSVGITEAQFEEVKATFDCFINSSNDSEFILDCQGLEDHLEQLQELIGYDTSEWEDCYVLMYLR